MKASISVVLVAAMVVSASCRKPPESSDANDDAETEAAAICHQNEMMDKIAHPVSSQRTDNLPPWKVPPITLSELKADPDSHLGKPAVVHGFLRLDNYRYEGARSSHFSFRLGDYNDLNARNCRTLTDAHGYAEKKKFRDFFNEVARRQREDEGGCSEVTMLVTYLPKRYSKDSADLMEILKVSFGRDATMAPDSAEQKGQQADSASTTTDLRPSGGESLPALPCHPLPDGRVAKMLRDVWGPGEVQIVKREILATGTTKELPACTEQVKYVFVGSGTSAHACANLHYAWDEEWKSWSHVVTAPSNNFEHDGVCESNPQVFGGDGQRFKGALKALVFKANEQKP